MRYAGTVLLFLPLLLQAAQPYTPELVNPLTQSWRWREYPELEGKGVRCIVEDRSGIVWFGVSEGVVSYDGYNWHWYGAEQGLINSPVEQLYFSREGWLYAVSSKGVFVLDDNTWTQIFTFHTSSSLNFFQLRELSSGSLMLGTHFGMVEIKDRKPVRIFTSPAKLKSVRNTLPGVPCVLLPDAVLNAKKDFTNVSDVIEPAPGALWMSITSDRHSFLLEFEPDEVTGEVLPDYSVVAPDGLPRLGETTKMLRAQDQSIWIINMSTHTGIHRFDGKRWSYMELSEIFGGDEFTTDIIQSLDGTIWIGALGKLYTFKNGTWEMYRSPDFYIPANRLILASSATNNLWIGGHKAKAYRLDYSTQRWITYRNLNFQCESNANEQWFLDVKGRAVQRKGNTWTAFDATDGLMDAPVRLIVTSQKVIWAAGSHNGIAATAYFDGNRWLRQLHPRLSWGIDYRAVFEARDGSIWFGGSVDFNKEKGQLGGVLQLHHPGNEPQEWVHHQYHENGLMQSNAYGIAQSPDGRIWIGGGNLFYFDGQTWNRPDQADFRQYVNVVHSTDSLLLVGSRHYGVFLFDGREWRQYDTESGLVSNTIISLYADSPGSIWAATENDIAHFDGQQWITGVFPSVMNMNVEGGSIQRSLDGALWINKSSREWKRRAFSFNKMPDEANMAFIAYRYRPDDKAPDTRIDLYNAENSYKSNMLVSWGGDDFQGDTPGEQLLFSYRLNGGPWSPFSNLTHHTFSNLGSGHYLLEVRARDLDFNIDNTPAAVNFVVFPPVWQQTWFVLLVLAFLTTIGIFEYRIITKKQKLERLNESLNRINAELKRKNEQVLVQQEQILTQKKALESSYSNLEVQNQEIQFQRDKLEEMVEHVETLSKSKINFFTNISHELRTPLTLILGPVEQLQRQSEGLKEADRKRLLDIIERNTYRLLKLNNQLLEMRRIENSTLDLKLRKANLAQYLDDIVQLFENLARERHIHLAFHNRCRNSLSAFDPDKIEKIVANLLSNAFKHTPEGGHITVDLDCLTRDDQPLYRIVVADTGAGIPASRLEHIFKRYYSAVSEPASTGIGLSYIKDLVDVHFGSIEVDSQEGVGTRLSIFIPANLTADQDLQELQWSEPQDFQVAAWEAHFLSAINGHSAHPAPVSDQVQHLPRLLILSSVTS